MFVDCPECNGPAEVTRTYFVKEVACAELYCLYDHRFAATVEWVLDHTLVAEYLPHSGFVILYYAAESDDSLAQWLNGKRPEDN